MSLSHTVSDLGSWHEGPAPAPPAALTPAPGNAVTSPTSVRSPLRVNPNHNPRAPIVPFEDSLAQKATKLPLIYGAPPRMGNYVAPLPQHHRRSPAPATAAKQQKETQQPVQKRLAEMTSDELAAVLRQRLEERRSVPRLSRKPKIEMPAVRVSHVQSITTTSADVVIANRLASQPAEAASDSVVAEVRLMISLDEGETYRTQAVAAADVFKVEGLKPGKRYHVYAVAAGGPKKGSKTTVLHFTTQNRPPDPRWGAAPAQDPPRPAQLPPISPSPSGEETAKPPLAPRGGRGS
jgi:hypothetical protein